MIVLVPAAANLHSCGASLAAGSPNLVSFGELNYASLFFARCTALYFFHFSLLAS